MDKYTERLRARILRSIVIDSNGCWIWQKTKSGGYGKITLSRTKQPKKRFVHLVTYELWVGRIPAGLQIDHVCRNRACCNPDPKHLEAVTPRENSLRSTSFAAINARKTHCPRKHEYDELNTYVDPDGQRRCRACRRK